MKRFIRINPEHGQIDVDASWMARHPDLKEVHHNHGVLINSFETVLGIFCMGTQAGDTHWTVVYSPIDSSQHIYMGKCAYEQAEAQINGAILGALKHWLPQFLPAEGE